MHTYMYEELRKSDMYKLFKPFKPMKYPSNWWDNLRWFFRSFKLAAQRIKRGYSDYDLADFGDYLTRMAACGLEDFRIKNKGYPGTLTEEEWDEMLDKASANFFLSIDELAQTIKVNITANFKYEIYPEDEWVSSGGRETVTETEFIQKFDVTAFKEKKESRETTVEFYANVKLEEGVYDKITKTITITQNRTLYIPKDSLHLALGDSAVVEVTNTEKRDLVWSTADEKEFTVDAKGMVKCVGNDGDGKATITVKSKDGKYSDEIIAVAKKPVDLNDYLKCSWVTKTATKEGVSTETLNFNIKNTSDQSITLTNYSFYKDSLDVSPWDASDISEPLGGNGSKTIDLGTAPTTNYYMILKYTYLNEKYILRFSKKGDMTIKKEEAPKPSATRRSSRSRR